MATGRRVVIRSITSLCRRPPHRLSRRRSGKRRVASRACTPAALISRWPMGRCNSLLRASITRRTADCRPAMVENQQMFSDKQGLTAQKGLASRAAALLATIVGIASFIGCGGAYDSTAHGVVTLDGRAVPRGTVSFHPVSGGPAAYAMIEDNGSYSIRTGREEGLPSGDYEVSVTA